MAKEKVRVMIVNNNHETLTSIKRLLEPFKEFKLTVETNNGNEAVELALKFQPDIVVMDAKMPVMDGYEAATRITRIAPYIGVILVGSAGSAEEMRKAMQSGANDYLELPFTGTQLQNTIASLYAIKKDQKKHLLENPLIISRRQPKVISVFSSKGGVGKTVLAVNVAMSLRTQTREDVLLMDMDLQFGDVCDLLNIKPRTSIVELVSDKSKIETNEVEKYLVTHHSGVKVLPAPEQPEQADLVDGKDVKELVSLFLNTFDYIVLDLPPLFNEVVLGAIEASDHILLITTMEVPTIKNIKGGLEILRRLDCPEEKITLVLNRFNDKREIETDDIKKFLNIQEIVSIDDNPEQVSASINTGEPLVLMYKGIPVAEQIKQLSKSMIENNYFKHKNKKTSFFQRIFGKRGRG